MKWPTLCLAVGLVLAATGMALDYYATPGHPVTVAPEADAGPVPEVTFHGVDGRNFGWEIADGRYVLVNFWATWCVPCKTEMPLLAELADRHRDRLVLVAVSVDAPQTDLAAFLRTLDRTTQRRLAAPNVRLVRDSDRAIAASFQVYRYPESYLIGPDRRIRQKIAGMLRAGDIRLDD